MRILHVITSGHRRGGDVFASDLAAVLGEDGIDQRVAALRTPHAPAVPFAVPVQVLGSGRRVLPGLNVEPGAVRLLSALISRWRPDVIQAHGGEPYKYVLAAAPRRRQPVVYRRIGGAPSWITHGPRRLVHAQLMRRASRIIAVAESVRRETIALFGVDTSKILTIPNGVSVDRVEPAEGRMETRRELGISEGAVVTLSLGALTWEKDPMTQLEILSRVLRQCSDAVHLFAGDGPMRRELEESIDQRDLRQRCRILGSRSDVGDIFAASDVFLFASRADGMEGMPATIIEAGMAGLPVAGYSIVGVPEVVEHGVTGLLATHGDVDTLSAHVLGLISDPGSRRAMGAAARERCRARFDIKAIAPRYLDLYSELVQAA